MRALTFERPGNPQEVLKLTTVPSPAPGPGQVRLRVTHRSINPSDLYCVQGVYPIQPTLPGSPGFEGAGVVDAVGEGVTGIAVGQRAIAATGLPGTWADQLVLPAQGIVPIPDAVSDQDGAQLLANPMTAWALLEDELSLKPGDWLLQTAAGSALGRLIIQLAKRRGIRTINVVRSKSHVKRLLDAGGDAVVCTADESLVDRVKQLTGGEGVRAAIDAVGGPEGAQVMSCVGKGGTMLVMGLLSGAALGPLDSGAMIFGGTTVRGFWLINWFGSKKPEEIQRAFGEVIGLVASGAFDLPVEAEYDLADFSKAIAHAERPGRAGKILLVSPQG
jgi:NADPH:quinone reductase-like Zn-dependent oxidoreductase